ncbi:MAG: hypothetical protein DHS20C02_10040 [Micavibrio sp.]|nr:MAG: hypothetical protein DHS20C02_10040 [Micavibrio sp.]
MTSKAKKNVKEEVVQAALALAVERGWAQASLRDVSERAGLSLGELHEHFDDKSDILVALGRMIDRQVLENIGEGEEGASKRDRLFDVLMERYEVLNNYRDGVSAVLDSFLCDPKQAVISLPHLARSMSWMLEAAGMETGGIKGAVKVAGLTGVYLKVLKTWKDDDSADLSKTMAALDKTLNRVDSLAGICGF